MTKEILDLISNVGFPIACCIYMAWYQVKKIDVFTETMTKNNTLLECIIAELSKEIES